MGAAVSWWTLTLRRVRRSPGVAAGVVVVLALTALLVATVAVSGPAVVTAALQDRLAAAPPDRRGVEVSARWDRSAPGPQDAAARRLVSDALAPVPVRVESVREGELLALAGRADRLVPWAGPAVQEHAALAAGRWPAAAAAGPVEAAVQAGAAAALGVRVGDVLRLPGPGAAAARSVVVVGLWAPRDAGDPFWRGQPLALQGLQREGVRGPLVVAEAAADRLGITWTVRWRAAPSLAAVTPELLQPLAASVAGLRGAVAALPAGGGPVPGAETGLSDLLAGSTAPVRSAAGAVRTLLVLLAAVAAALCLLVGSTLAQVRAGDDGVLRARGAGAMPRLLLGLREGAGWAAAAAVPAALLAPAAVAHTGPGTGGGTDTGAGSSPGRTVLAAVAWTAAIALLLVAVTALAARALRRGARRRPGETLPLRPPTLLVLAVAAAAAAWQLRSASGSAGGPPAQVAPDDPVLVVAVAVLLVAASVLVVVALAALARPVARAAGRAGPVGALALWHAGRRGLQPVAAVAVVVLCGAGGVCLLAARQAGQDAAVAAAHREVAPVAAVAAPAPPGTPVEAGAAQAAAAGARLAALPGVAAVSPVLSIDGSVGSSGAVRVLAVDRDLVARLTAGAEPAAVPPASAALLRGRTGDPRSQAVSAVLSASLARTLAVTTGQQVDVEDVAGRRLRLVVAGIAPSLPADPFRPDGTPVALVDRADLLRAEAAAPAPAGQAAGPPEPVRPLPPRAVRQWWLLPVPGADPARVAADALAMVGPLAPAEVRAVATTRAGAERRLLDEPVTRGLARLDLVGAGGLAVAGAGALLLGQLATTRGRRGELAVLRAVGLSTAQARRLALAEALLVGGLAVVAGVLLGTGLTRWSTGQLTGLGPAAGDGLRPAGPAAVLAVLGAGVLVVAVVRARVAGGGDVAAVVREQAS